MPIEVCLVVGNICGRDVICDICTVGFDAKVEAAFKRHH